MNLDFNSEFVQDLTRWDFFPAHSFNTLRFRMAVATRNPFLYLVERDHQILELAEKHIIWNDLQMENVRFYFNPNHKETHYELLHVRMFPVNQRQVDSIMTSSHQVKDWVPTTWTAFSNGNPVTILEFALTVV